MFLISRYICVAFLLCRSPMKRVIHQTRGADSSFSSRSDAMHVQIAAAYFASTCRCVNINEHAPCSLQPNCAFSGANGFALCCSSAVMGFGAWGHPRDPQTPGELRDGMHRAVVVPWEAARESLHNTDWFCKWNRVGSGDDSYLPRQAGMAGNHPRDTGCSFSRQRDV